MDEVSWRPVRRRALSLPERTTGRIAFSLQHSAFSLPSSTFSLQPSAIRTQYHIWLPNPNLNYYNICLWVRDAFLLASVWVVDGDVLLVAPAQLLDGLLDLGQAALLAHPRGGEVGVGPGAVPVALYGTYIKNGLSVQFR